MRRSPQTIAAYRARYTDHQRQGLAFKSKALEGTSPRPAPVLAPGVEIAGLEIPGDWYGWLRVGAGEGLRIEQAGRPTTVALALWSARDSSERLCLPDTIKLQWTTVLSHGRVLFSDMGRVMASIVEDSHGRHDVLAGGTTPASAPRPDHGPGRNTRDNLVLAAAKLGLERRDIPNVFNLFAPVVVTPDGRLAWDGESHAEAGDHYLTLRADMDLLVALSTCRHPLDPAPQETPAPIRVRRIALPPAPVDDLCRTATAEAKRGFENTDDFRS